MTKEIVKVQGAGPGCCEALGAVVVGRFAASLEAEARTSGGSLTAQRIKEAAAHFLRDGAPLEAIYQNAFDDCTRAREAAAWDQARRHPFDRILTKRFAHLFPARSGDDGAPGGGVLSRRVIPGFSLVLTKMIGPDLYEQCQVKAQAIVERHRAGPQVDWKGVYADDEAQALANDVLVVVARYFTDFDRRRDWFVAIVNANLAAPTPGGGDEHWQLTEPIVHLLLRALFADLGAAAAEDSHSLRVRYSDDTFETLVDFLTRLERAE